MILYRGEKRPTQLRLSDSPHRLVLVTQYGEL